VVKKGLLDDTFSGRLIETTRFFIVFQQARELRGDVPLID